MSYREEVLKFFGITTNVNWQQVHCPYHGDKTKSAGVFVNSEWFNCFVCGSKSFKQVYDEIILPNNQKTELVNTSNKTLESLINSATEDQLDKNDRFLLKLTETITQQTGKSYRIKREVSELEIYDHLNKLIESKGISTELLQKVGAYPILDKADNLFGYIKFPSNNGWFVARKFLPDDIIDGEKYLNASGEKPFYGEIKDEVKEYIIVEGIYDYLTLIELGYDNVVCNLGTAFNERRSYRFKGKTAFILFDNDFAGYDGAQKAYAALRKVRSYPIILDLPSKFGKDINEGFVSNRDETIKWLREQLDTVETKDTAFITDFGREEKLYSLRTSFPKLNEYLMGGFKEGTHGLAAKPGVGKTALMLHEAQQFVLANTIIDKNTGLERPVRGLYCSYEIPKAQCWARISSIYDNEHSWVEIERDREVSDTARKITAKIAENLKIVDNWGISEIARAIDNYDFFVIDYIQVMPGDSIDERTRVARNIRAISQLRQEYHKLFFVVSSIPRSSYDKEDLSVFKESGDIEFAIQSGFLLQDISAGSEQRLLNLLVLKNTRGPSQVNMWIKGSMAHNYFKESGTTIFDKIEREK